MCVLVSSFDAEDYIRHSIESMKRNGAIKIFDEIYNSNCPIVVETHLEEWQDPLKDCIRYSLHYRLTVVQTRNIVLPVFEFVNHDGIKEWKCPACGIINNIKATYCGEMHKHAVGCGSPRDKIQ